MRPRTLAALVAVPACAQPAAADARVRVSGPRVVTPGEVVTYRLRGLPAGTRVFVLTKPIPACSTCGRVLNRSFRVSRRGRARVRFRFPRTYLDCSRRCGSEPYGAHERARIRFSAAESRRAPFVAGKSRRVKIASR